MRIAFSVHKYPPESLGGTEIYTEGLARALALRGHEVFVFAADATPDFPSRQSVRDGVALWRVAGASAAENPVAQYWHTYRNRRIEAEFSRFMTACRPDLLHIQHVQGVSARLLEMAQGVPKVVTLHDYWYFCANSQLIRPDRQPCAGPSTGCLNCVDCATDRSDLNWLRALRPLVAAPFAYRNGYLRKMLSTVDRFVAPSAFLRQQYVDHGFPGANIQVIENGIDLDRLQRDPDHPFPEPDARPHFGFLGSLAWQKGVHILVEAFNQAPEHAALTIYGSGSAFPEYAAKLKSIAAHPHIRFAGPIAPHQVGSALDKIDCLVTPSLWYENSPLVIQEAYAAGVPVLASRLGALTEKVADGRTGALFPAGDVESLRDLMSDLIERPQRLAEWRAQIQPPCSMAQHAEEIESLYTTLKSETGAAELSAAESAALG